MTPTIAQVLEIMEELAPAGSALPEDPVGLQCGDPGRPSKRVMLALDASLSTVRQALSAAADLLVTHHPLLFKPIGPGNIRSPGAEAFVKAVRGGLAVFSAHTNLDASLEGINASLADIVGLEERKILLPTGPGLFKAVVFLPQPSLAAVREAAFSAGAGSIGHYSRCSFAAPGEGTFMGDETTNPAVGVAGRSETVAEARLEVLVPEGRLERVLDAVRKAHPYEVPVVDVFPLRGKPEGIGIGLVGQLPGGKPVGEIASVVKRALRQKAVRMVGTPGRKVRKVAVCAGSGGSLLPAVLSSRAQLYISGDIKFHEARTAQEENLSVLDVGHFGPEKHGMLRFGEKIAGRIREKGWDVAILHAKEKDPFVTMG